MTAACADLGGGLWTWTARHPEWHPGEFGAGCAATPPARGDHTLLIDPLVLVDETWEELDGIVTGPVDTVITIGYHVRSAEAAQEPLRRDRSIGPPAVGQAAALDPVVSALCRRRPLPFGAVAHPVGNPRRQETPLELPELSALVFGDAVVEARRRAQGVGAGTAHREAAEVVLDAASAERRAAHALGVERVLVTHGEPVLEGGRRN